MPTDNTKSAPARYRAKRLVIHSKKRYEAGAELPANLTDDDIGPLLDSDAIELIAEADKAA